MINILIKFCIILLLINSLKKFKDELKKNYNTFSGSLKINNLSFNFTNIKSYFSYKYNFVNIIYNIEFFDSNLDIILPSDLTLLYNYHVLCFMNVKNSINIYSLPSIVENNYFRCIEYFGLNELIKIGIIIYRTDNNGNIEQDYIYYHILDNLFNYNYEDDNIFNSSKIYEDYKLLLNKIKYNNGEENQQKLKNLYISQPICMLKRDIFEGEKEWVFRNIYNNYFCFCAGLECLNGSISKECKYYFYLYLIDINKNVYEKTDFLLMDFILRNYSSDDVYPIFEKMINKNLNAHYITGNENIYQKYCNNTKRCNSVIYVEGKNYIINDNFLEKYFTLFLKLKQVLSSAGVIINYINNIFYNIDYITYICVGHGVSYFKNYLYKEYYGPQNFDKIIIPESKKLIIPALKCGWKEDNIIKINLPRWDKYEDEFNFFGEKGKIKSNSIFIMFTWRELKKNSIISSYYINNIFKLLYNQRLINILSKNNLFLYFSLHHKLTRYRKKFHNKGNVIYIEETEISECLTKTKLIVTDYSSIIFDIIYRRKPYIIYIPDAFDPNIKNIYNETSYNIIKSFISGDYDIKNINFDIDSTIHQINYYINNKFKLDKKLKTFYKELNLKKGVAINKLINILLKM